LLLSDKVALVTGGSNGIGLGIAKRFIENGAIVAICARHADRLEKAASLLLEQTGVNPLAIVCDVADKDDVGKCVDQVMGQYGRIDILVNNAGVQVFEPFLEMKTETWDYHFNVNVRGAFLVAQKVANIMAARHQGKIVNISSDSGCAPLPDNASAYCASKAALISLTRNMAKELGPLGVYCNCICPGAIKGTAMMDYFLDYTDGAGEKLCTEAAALRRMGTPGDIAEVAVFLASSMSDFITGEKILVTGGDLMSQ